MVPEELFGQWISVCVCVCACACMAGKIAGRGGWFCLSSGPSLEMGSTVLIRDQCVI